MYQTPLSVYQTLVNCQPTKRSQLLQMPYFPFTSPIAMEIAILSANIGYVFNHHMQEFSGFFQPRHYSTLLTTALVSHITVNNAEKLKGRAKNYVPFYHSAAHRTKKNCPTRVKAQETGAGNFRFCFGGTERAKVAVMKRGAQCAS